MLSLRLWGKLGYLRRTANRLDPLGIQYLYMYCIRPAAKYARKVWSGLSTTDSARHKKLNRAGGLILKVLFTSQISQDHDILLARAGLQLISIQRKLRQAIFCSTYFEGFHPEHLKLTIDNWRLYNWGVVRQNLQKRVHITQR